MSVIARVPLHLVDNVLAHQGVVRIAPAASPPTVRIRVAPPHTLVITRRKTTRSRRIELIVNRDDTVVEER
jgi:hypothetical protein